MKLLSLILAQRMNVVFIIKPIYFNKHVFLHDSLQLKSYFLLQRKRSLKVRFKMSES